MSNYRALGYHVHHEAAESVVYFCNHRVSGVRVNCLSLTISKELANQIKKNG